MATAFGNAIEFFKTLGVYEVVLPFILTFTIIYAILDKTKILGTEKIGKEEMPRRNLNSLVAFCIGLFVVASASIVSVINQAMGQIVLLVFISVFFLMSVGLFFKKDEDVSLHGGWRAGFMVATLVGILLIFANAIILKNGKSVLQFIYEQIAYNYNSNAVASLILVGFIILIMYFVVKEPKKSEEKKGGDK
jgi:hypothetical protein